MSAKGIKDLQVLKEKEIASMITQFESMLNGSLARLRMLSSTFDVEKALKSMRKLPLLGDALKKVSFEFPSVEELKQLCEGEPV